VSRFENELITQALQRTHGNKNKAADLLRLNRTTLVEKIKRRRLESEE
jgi:DNA-binding NtrC family response regulator